MTQRRTLAVGAGLYAIFMGLHVLLAWDGGRVIRTFIPGVDGWIGPAGWAIYAAVAVLAIPSVGMPATGLTRGPSRGSWRLVLAPLAAGLPFILFGINVAPGDIVPLLVVGVPLIALNEELFYRGILLPLLRPMGWHRAVLWSSIAFARVAPREPRLAARTRRSWRCRSPPRRPAASRWRRSGSGSGQPVAGPRDACRAGPRRGRDPDRTGDREPRSSCRADGLAARRNLALWRYGWWLLAGLDDHALDRLAAGIGPDAAASLRPAPGASGRPCRGRRS